MVRAVRPPWAAPPRIAVDGHGKPWSMSDDGDWCFQCGVPTVDRDGADDPCCWNCPGGGQDRREGRTRSERTKMAPPPSPALTQPTDAGNDGGEAVEPWWVGLRRRRGGPR